MDTTNIKVGLSTFRRGLERAYHEQYEVAHPQSQVDEMRTEMIKTDQLEIWAKNMEGGITLVLSILDDWMGKLEIEGGIMAEGSSVTNDTPSPLIIALEKKCDG